MSVFCRQLGYFTNRSSQELNPYLLRKPLGRPCARLGDLFRAVTRWCVRFERAEKGTGDCCYLVNRGKECSFVGFRWLVEAGDLAHELERGRANLVLGHGWREIEEDSDISAHTGCLEMLVLRLKARRTMTLEWEGAVNGGTALPILDR